ncbi:MAG: tol-pal system protein YbgF [Desulfuromonadales bacterium]
MFRHFFTALAMLLLLSGLSGCAPSQRQVSMERDLAEMKRRLASVEKRTIGMGDEFTTGMEDRLSELKRRQAETQAGLDGLRVEMHSLHGRMEDMASANQQFQEEVSLIREDLGLKVAAIEDRLNEIENTMENKGNGEPDKQETAEKTTADPSELYEKGRDLIREGDQFSEARQILQNFIDDHPDHPLAVNAAYWIGEAFYGEKKYENAILQFQDIIEDHSDHNKVPDALLKQGLAFRAMDDRDNARVILEKVVEDHSDSNAAGKAQKILGDLQ